MCEVDTVSLSLKKIPFRDRGGKTTRSDIFSRTKSFRHLLPESFDTDLGTKILVEAADFKPAIWMRYLDTVKGKKLQLAYHYFAVKHERRSHVWVTWS